MPSQSTSLKYHAPGTVIHIGAGVRGTREPTAQGLMSNSPFHEMPVFAADPVSDRLQRGEFKDSS